MISFPTRTDEIEAACQSYKNSLLKILAGGMFLTAFIAYLTSQYIQASTPLISASFLLLLATSFVLDDGHSKFNLNRPKEGILLCSVFAGFLLGLIFQSVIADFLIFFLGTACFFLIMGFYGSIFKQDLGSIETLIALKYIAIFFAIFLKFAFGCSFSQICLTVLAMMIVILVYYVCTCELDQVFRFYHRTKPVSELNFLGAFKLYKGFFRYAWVIHFFPFILLFSNFHPIRVPEKKEEQHEEAEENYESQPESPRQSSEAQLARYTETQKLLYTGKNTRHIH